MKHRAVVVKESNSLLQFPVEGVATDERPRISKHSLPACSDKVSEYYDVHTIDIMKIDESVHGKCIPKPIIGIIVAVQIYKILAKQQH